MSLLKTAATVFTGAGVELGCFVLSASLIFGTSFVETAHAQSADLSRMPLTSERNDYANAVGQKEPAAKAEAINAFLARYPYSRTQEDMLEQLMAVYVSEPDTNKATETVNRILTLDPKNLRALFYMTYTVRQKALSADTRNAQQLLDVAAQAARTALNAPSKPDYMSEADFDKLRVVTSPMFHSAIGIDDLTRRDFFGAISNFTMELKAPVNIKATESGFELDDTYRLGQAYEGKSPADLKSAAWFYARAAQYSTSETKAQWEAKAESTYLDYHGSMDGYPEVQALARQNVFPPPEYNPTRTVASR
jgi:hypothetical protein